MWTPEHTYDSWPCQSKTKGYSSGIHTSMLRPVGHWWYGCVITELMLSNCWWCSNSPSALLSPRLSSSAWRPPDDFQVWVYWCFMASDLLSHTLNTDTHIACNNAHTRSQCFAFTCESGKGAHNQKHTHVVILHHNIFYTSKGTVHPNIQNRFYVLSYL